MADRSPGARLWPTRMHSPLNRVADRVRARITDERKGQTIQEITAQEIYDPQVRILGPDQSGQRAAYPRMCRSGGSPGTS